MLTAATYRYLGVLAFGWFFAGPMTAAEKESLLIFPSMMSPDGKYAVAWSDASYRESGEAPNFVVETAKKQVIIEIPGGGYYETAAGSRPQYLTLEAGWADDSEVAVTHYAERWGLPQNVAWIALKSRKAYEILPHLQQAYRAYVSREGIEAKELDVLFGEPVVLSKEILVIDAEVIRTVNHRPLASHRIKVRVKTAGKDAKLTVLGGYEIHDADETRPVYGEDREPTPEEKLQQTYKRLLAALDEPARAATAADQTRWLQQREAAKLEGKALDDFIGQREYELSWEAKIQESYRSLLATLDDAGKAALKDGQSRWLQQRAAIKGDAKAIISSNHQRWSYLSEEAALNGSYQRLRDSLDETEGAKLQQDQEHWLEQRKAESQEISATHVRAGELHDELALNKAYQRLHALLHDAGRAKLKLEQERWLKQRAAQVEGTPLTSTRAGDLEDEADLHEAYQQLRAKLGEKERTALREKQQVWLKVRAALGDESDRFIFTTYRTNYLRARFEDLTGKFTR